MSNIKNLVETFLHMKSSKEMKDFLLGILTPKEIEEISRRLEIIKMLKKGVSQHVIAENLGVGVATVTRGSRELKNKRFQYI